MLFFHRILIISKLMAAIYMPNYYSLIVKDLNINGLGLNSQFWNSFPIGTENSSKKICVVK